jgi:hypothetical protein
MDDDHAILCSVLSEYSKVFIFVDALDEYPEEQRNTLLSHLSALRPAPNLMLTSRPHIKFDHIIADSDLVEVRATEADIRRYVDAQISKFPRLSKHVTNSADLREEIESTILRRSDGM